MSKQEPSRPAPSGLDYLNGGADGLFGASMRNAVTRRQDNGLDESRYFKAEQVRTLGEQVRR